MLLWNGITIGIILLVLLVILIYKLRNPIVVPKLKTNVDSEKFNINSMTKYIKTQFNEMTGRNLYDNALDRADFERQKNMRVELKAALKGCNSGDLYDKMYVKDLIHDLLMKGYGMDEQNVNYVLPFDDPEKLTVQDKFEILMQIYKKKYKYKALPQMIEEYQLDELKYVIEDGLTESYIITEEEILDIYQEKAGKLSFEDKMQVIVQRIYQEYKGFGVIDEIRNMLIDGVSGGVSGLPAFSQDIEDEQKLLEAMRTATKEDVLHSVWIMYRGKTMHLSFLSFGSEREIKRICQSIYKYNNPGQLTEQNGYIINDMKDNSRIVVMRPPFAETWVFFNRKFDLTFADLENFLNPKGRGYSFKNTILPLRFIPFLMKSTRTIAVTGEQGSGKSTFIMACIKFYAATLALRIMEMAFELHLRKLFPRRNIVTTKETAEISGQQGMDVQKKTDGAVNIIGEAATDEQVTWIIQAGTVASKCTIFSHHPKTFKDLISSLRNSALKTGLFQNEFIAEQQVVSILNFDVHLFKDPEGRRYIERITECVPLFYQENPYPEDSEKARIEFYKRMTDKRAYEERDIIVFEDEGYVAKNPITEQQKKDMMKQMTKKDCAAFEEMLATFWPVAS
ncbi:pilus assembly protein CpaF [Paenibacillus polymyxa]|uniref:pilus assembly protein CpaF n=1 Tax=Paenibacillus polymyxa TaxID=1406 RepID=UPI0032172606